MKTLQRRVRELHLALERWSALDVEAQVGQLHELRGYETVEAGIRTIEERERKTGAWLYGAGPPRIGGATAKEASISIAEMITFLRREVHRQTDEMLKSE